MHHISLLFVFAFAAPAVAQVTYVDVDATGAGDGSSWLDAYTDLQDALANTPSGDVWVAEGAYRPGASGNYTATFQLVSGVRLFGGFAGGETSVHQRDSAAHPTILSGDLDGDDTYGAGANWWQFNWTGSTNNSYHVVTGTGADATAVLDGFGIHAGVGRDPAFGAGGGLLVLGGAPTLRHLDFRYNAVGYGSSAYLDDCTSVFEHCVIRDAYTCNCGAGGWTSGIICTGTSSVSFTDCNFLNHYYVSAMSQGRGAALNIDFGANASLLRCLFEGNQTGNFFATGGGTAYGAGVNAHGNVVVDRCSFIDNFAHAGAGLTIWASATVTNSLFARNEAVPHAETSQITYGNYGAGLLTLGGSGQVVTITGCSFVDNNCNKGAGMALYGASSVVIRNCIVYDNYADPQAPGEDPIFILQQNLVGDFDIAFSCVEGLLQTEPGEDPPDPSNFPGCIDTSPLLVDMAGWDYRLSSSSPCIDAGTNAALTIGASLDLAGAPRRFDDPATPDSGSGTAPLVDMGALEFGHTLLGDAEVVSLAAGGVQHLSIHARAAHAGQLYAIGGSATGTSPGIPIDGVVVPLVYDAYTEFTLASLNSSILQNTLGWLDAAGEATATFAVPAGTNPSLAGITLRHAALVIDPFGTGLASLATNPIAVLLVD